jgi:hypothetical protein
MLKSPRAILNFTPGPRGSKLAPSGEVKNGPLNSDACKTFVSYLLKVFLEIDEKQKYLARLAAFVSHV